MNKTKINLIKEIENMQYFNTVKALSKKEHKLVTGFLINENTLKVYTDNGEGNTVEILSDKVRKYICTTKLGVHLYVDDIISVANGQLTGLIKFGSRIDDLGYNQVCYYIEWLSPNSNSEIDERNYLRTDLGYWLNKSIIVIGNDILNNNQEIDKNGAVSNTI